jgi:hypothetical protein
MAIERMLGIVGGVGPESSADYYRRLVSRWRERGPAGTYPSILLDSLNSKPALDALLEGDLDPTVRLFDASVHLAGGGQVRAEAPRRGCLVGRGLQNRADGRSGWSWGRTRCAPRTTAGQPSWARIAPAGCSEVWTFT